MSTVIQKELQLVELTRGTDANEDTLVQNGEIALITVDSASVWKAVLFLYMADTKQPLPTHEEVVICTETTTVREIKLLWHRAVNDEEKKKIFCLVNADKLPFNVSEEVLNHLEKITQSSFNHDYRIAVVISNARENAMSNVASRLHRNLRKLDQLPSDDDVVQYIASHFMLPVELQKLMSFQQKRNLQLFLSHTVHVVSSISPGMGKSLRIKRIAKVIEQIRSNRSDRPSYINIPIRGPELSVHHILDLMEDCQQDPTRPYPQLIHFDIAQNVIEHNIDWFIFQVLILGRLTDSFGKAWKKTHTQICVVECTLVPNYENKKSVSSCKSLLSYFPQTHCLSPKEVQDLYQSNTELKNFVAVDEHFLQGEDVQRVYQNLKGLCQHLPITSNRKSSECLNHIIECLSSDYTDDIVSWSQIKAFVKFLNMLLQDFEKSLFFIIDEFKPFRELIVHFLVAMAKTFTKPSVNISKVAKNLHTDGSSIYKLKDWTACSHPCLFFNEGGFTVTVLGQWINSFADSQYAELMEHLKLTLEDQAPFQNDYNKYNKKRMLLQLARVVGIDELEFTLEGIEPDFSYVLTVDNLMKMLVIHIKLKCGIPVILMGDTGCGKTQLIRYLCGMQQKSFGVRSFYCLKVHPGITASQISDAVKSASQQALENRKTCNYTVLFFDEVNTTEALGLIKEVMCDRTLYGKPIPEELKFAAACNPYKMVAVKHVQVSDIDHEKITKIDKFKKVYHVSPLPLGMYHYVHDFGVLSSDIETMYVKKIVDFQFSHYKYTVDCDASVLNDLFVKVFYECQDFMREQEGDTNYVSLRDVLRTIKVFKWFLEKLTIIDMLKEKLFQEVDKDKDLAQFEDLSSVTRALIYSLSVCYYARLALDERKLFAARVVQCFTGEGYTLPGNIAENVIIFEKEVERIQTVFLNAMNIPVGIAHNAALRENIFMMVVCIENRLPLFIVGKPGSSKSLAKSIVSNSMRGRYSSNELLRSFKQVQLFPRESTCVSANNESTKVFNEAIQYQASQNVSQFVSVIHLEAFDLANKDFTRCFYSFLEIGIVDAQKEEIKPEERVAFVGMTEFGIVDPAKLNRGIVAYIE